MAFLALSPAGRRYGRWSDNTSNPARKLRALHADPAIVLPTAAMDLCAFKGPTRNQGQEGSCHDEKTEILTDGGWKKFADIDGSERLATVNPDDGKLFYERPIRIVKMYYGGDVYCAENDSLNFCVTPEHKMLVRKWNERKRTLDTDYTLVPMKDIGWYSGLLNRIQWLGEGSDVFTLPGVSHKFKEYRESRDVAMSAWMNFLGIYLAEGTMLKRDQRQGELNYKIQLAATKEREKKFIRDTLKAIGVHALELKDRFTFHNANVYEALASLGLEGIKAASKFVPRFVFNQSADNIKCFLDGHMAGDGCDLYSHWNHYTSSSKLANDLQLLIFLSGHESRIAVRAARTAMMADGRSVVGSMPEHRVSVCRSKNMSIERKKSVFTRSYEGYVYCAEVPTYHTLVTRREGKILISGNCTGNAGGSKVDLDYRQFADWPDRNVLPAQFEASAEFIYLCNLIADGNLGTDAGSSMHQTAITISQKGACTNDDMPYSDKQYSTPPDATQYADGLLYRMDAYHFLPDLQSMKACLAPSAAGPGHSFIFGISVYDSFEGQWSEPGFMPVPNLTAESLQGGHAQHVIGYDDTIVFPDGSTGGLFVQNSWGGQDVWPEGINAPGHSDGGCYWMSYKFVTGSDPANGPFTNDAWINHTGPIWK